MARILYFTAAMTGAALLSTGVAAQDIAPSPRASVPIAAVAEPPPPSSDVAPYYASHPGSLIWLRDADRRAAAAKLAELLKDAELDGLADGPALAAAVEAAAAVDPAQGDPIISKSWVRYVQALQGPVAGVSYGDPALRLHAPPADAILSAAESAPSLTAHVNNIARVNPFRSALRSAALSHGSAADPHVRATLDRLRLVPASGRAILVDVANAELMMLEDGAVVDSMKVIVGKRDFPTPLLAGTIHYVTFNPYWHIPQDVARRKVAPIVLKRGTAYLKAAKYDTVSKFGEGAEPVDPDTIDWKAVAAGKVEANIQQRSGANNMMGKMKFGFVNNYGIFLHDTPHKDLFAKAKRTLSLGCVRLEHPERLARWLLGRDPVAPSDGTEQLVQLDKGVPVDILALTARPDGDAVVFAADVYNLDGPASSAAASVVKATP